MNQKFIKKGIVVATLAATILAPTAQVLAAEAVSILNMPKQNKQVELEEKTLINAVAEISENTFSEKTIKIDSTVDIKLNDILSGKTFAKVGEEGYLSFWQIF